MEPNSGMGNSERRKHGLSYSDEEISKEYTISKIKNEGWVEQFVIVNSGRKYGKLLPPSFKN